MARVWTCQKCKTKNARVKQRCPTCAAKRPTRRRPAHQAALDQPYEWWVAKYGEVCGICDRPPTAKRLHRDHDHKTGEPRGLLCFPCNSALRSYMTIEWLRKALAYLTKP